MDIMQETARRCNKKLWVIFKLSDETAKIYLLQRNFFPESKNNILKVK